MQLKQTACIVESSGTCGCNRQMKLPFVFQQASKLRLATRGHYNNWTWPTGSCHLWQSKAGSCRWACTWPRALLAVKHLITLTIILFTMAIKPIWIFVARSLSSWHHRRHHRKFCSAPITWRT